MFKVLTGEKKRRAISPATITASIAAHLLLLGGLVYASTGQPAQVEDVEPDSILRYVELEPKAPPPPPVVQQPTPPAQPDVPDEPVVAPRRGNEAEIPEVREAPDGVKPEEPGAEPVDLSRHTGQGEPGDVPGPPTGPTGPTGPEVTEPAEDYIPDESMVEVRPVLDRNGLGRALERNYPPVLRDARVSGRVVIELIVDENGRPRPGSARVVDASHSAFADAALRAVDRFRFRPARIGGTAVPVRVTIPIQWTVPN
ncbi:MAG TPA: TonB family protein [Longimicrobium sp.]|nr:TonB family protein [Longimicrobium sp.]